MTRFDRIAIVLSIVAAAAAYLVAGRVFDHMPHVEDEMAYVWQAQVFSQGKLTLPTPPDAKSLMVPFIVDYHGQRFGKYPPGWPMALAFGLLLHARDWVNPILAGLGIWLTYRLGKKLFDERIALLAGFLTLTSPFFLLNSSSLFSHPWSLFLSLAFVLAWLDTFNSAQQGSQATRTDIHEGKPFDSLVCFVFKGSPAKWLTVSIAGLSLRPGCDTLRANLLFNIGEPKFRHGEDGRF